MTAADFRTHLIALKFVERDDMERVGICPDTAARMRRDPVLTFKSMSHGERARFWPLVQHAADQLSPLAPAQILSGESSRETNLGNQS
jgi:hypothetical protein